VSIPDQSKRSHFHSKRSLYAASLCVLTLALSVGCSGLKKNRSDDFVKPLGVTSTETNRRSQTPPDERTLCMETAKTVAQQGHASEAIQLYQRAEELGPSQAPLDKQLAPLHAQLGEYDVAIERYQRLVSTSPQDAGLCNNFAWTLMEAQQFQQAVAQVERGLAIDADHQRLRTTLAMIRYRQGDRKSALAEFAKAHDATAAHHNLAVLEIDAGDLPSAQQHLRQASQVDGAGRTKASPETEAIIAALDQQPVQR